VGGVVIQRNRGEVGARELVVGHIGTVDLELELVRGTEHGNTRSVRGCQVLDGVVEVEFLNLGTRGNRLLNLCDEHVLGRPREQFPLLSIEVRVVGIDFPLVRRGAGTPRDTKLNIVVLEGDEGERGLPVLAKGEPERVELLGSRTSVETTRHRLGGRGRRKGRGDEGGVDGVLVINHLTPDEEFHFGDGSGPIRDGVGLGTIRLDGHEIDIVEHVTLALKADGGHAVV